MSENIVIKTNGTENTYSVDGLNTALADDTARDQDWEFEAEDTSDYVKMTVGENGEYNAEDYGAKAITEVEVTEAIDGVETEETELELEERTPVITVGGKARIMDGVKKLRVNGQNEGTLDLIPKTVYGILNASQKGIYRAADDGYDGYSAVNIDVRAGGGGGGGGGWTDVPDEIRVTVPPIKTNYYDGDTIDYTGMVVTGYVNNMIWSDREHPDGVIPISELTLPVTIAFAQKKVLSVTSELDCGFEMPIMLAFEPEIKVAYEGRGGGVYYHEEVYGKICEVENGWVLGTIRQSQDNNSHELLICSDVRTMHLRRISSLRNSEYPEHDRTSDDNLDWRLYYSYIYDNPPYTYTGRKYVYAEPRFPIVGNWTPTTEQVDKSYDEYDITQITNDQYRNLLFTIVYGSKLAYGLQTLPIQYKKRNITLETNTDVRVHIDMTQPL